MKKYNIFYIYAIFSMIEILKFVNCNKSNCSNKTTKEQCITESTCNWILDVSKDKCSNIHPDCSLYNYSPKDCLATSGCLFQPGNDGFCNQKTSLGCSDLQKSECSQNKSCVWTSLQECEHKEGGFGCTGLNENKCNEQIDFCTSVYQCKDFDEKKCLNLSKQDCLDAQYCDYTQSQPEKCASKQGFCEQLSPDECQSNQDFCIFEESTPFSCDDQKDQDICKLLTEDCSYYPNYCDIVPQPCLQKTDCNLYIEEFDCLNNGCQFNDNLCTKIIDCTQITSEKDCAQEKTCFQTPYQCKNKDSFNCSSKSNWLDCKGNQKFCVYTPAKGNCKSKEHCVNLSGYDCQFYQKECSYTYEVGSCTIKNDLKCSEKNHIDCLDLPYCTAEFTQCQDIKADVCSIMNTNECGDQLNRCQPSAQGYCSDNIIQCPSSKADCSQNDQCDWMGEVPSSCVVSLDCTYKSSTECKAALNLCSYTQGGSCESINEFAQVYSIQLLFSVFLFISTNFIFVF